jgi:hypothetical protein
MGQIKFKVFGLIVLVEKDADGWRAYYPGTDGKKRLADFIIPKDIKDDELDQYLGDLFHENARPNKADVVRF